MRRLKRCVLPITMVQHLGKATSTSQPTNRSESRAHYKLWFADDAIHCSHFSILSLCVSVFSMHSKMCEWVTGNITLSLTSLAASSVCLYQFRPVSHHYWIGNVIAFFAASASVCVSRQSSSIYSWLALCPYKYACECDCIHFSLSLFRCVLVFLYGRMQFFLTLLRLLPNAFFWSFILLGIVQMNSFAIFRFLCCSNCLVFFFLPSLHAAQNFNCFSFSFICSAAANWSNKNRFEERRDQKVPQTSCNEEFAFKNPILFVIQLKQPFSAVFVGLFILSCQFFFLSTPVLNWALRRCYCGRCLLLEIEHLHSDEREKRFTAVYSHTSSTVHVLIVYYFAFQMESISRKFVKMWCGKLIMMMAAANSTHSSSIEA